MVLERMFEAPNIVPRDHFTTYCIRADAHVSQVGEVDKQGTVLLISEWGWDGSTGHSKYKQRSLEDATDSDIFITSVVPLQLYSEKASGDSYSLGKS
jgi:hypothetical protein